MARTRIRLTPRFARGVLFVVACAAAGALTPGHRLIAQETAARGVSSRQPTIAYARNESGGRISVESPASDSASVESVRVLLLESAAAVRRGDFANLRIVSRDAAAMQLLADQRGAIRCTVRLTPRGGDLMLLSNDESVVAAIHQLLANPPASVRLL